MIPLHHFSDKFSVLFTFLICIWVCVTGLQQILVEKGLFEFPRKNESKVITD